MSRTSNLPPPFHAYRKRPTEDATDGPSKKKPKKESANGSSGPDRTQLMKQSKRIFGYRDKLKKIGKPELQLLLEENGQEVAEGIERVKFLCSLI